jgi:phage gp16-like protein
MTSGTTENRRKKLIQLIHIGKGKMGLTDDAYRAFLEGICGKQSCADMTERQLAEVLWAMRRNGFDLPPRRVQPNEKGSATLSQLEYIKGMWQKCARNKSDDALRAFVNRIARVKSLRFLTVETARKVLLALQDMAAKAESKAEAKASLGIDPDTSEPKVPPESLDD